MDRRDDAPDEATGEPLDAHFVLDPPPPVTLAGADYDPAARFRGRHDDLSVTAANSATDAEVEWIVPPQRYGHFSGRPLDPVEIAAERRRRDRRRWALRGMVASAFLAGVSLFVWSLIDDPWLPLSMAEPGICFKDSQSSLIVRDDTRYRVRTTLEVVDCAAPHEFEVVGTATMSGFGETLEMAATADRLCAGVFEGYVGAPPEDAAPWRLATFPPYLMFLAGERAHCLAYQGTSADATDDPYRPVPVSGSARDGAG